MSIGFAAVSATLYLNGTIGIGTNNDDFDVYFSKAVENGVENNRLIQDKTHIAFTTELSEVGEKYVLNYEVTNASKQYDANLTMNCIGGNEYLRVENKFDVSKILPARTTRNGNLTLKVIKGTVDQDIEVNITCEIKGNAVERDELGGDTIVTEKDSLALAINFTAESMEEIFIIEKFGSLEKFEAWMNEACSEEETCQIVQNDLEKEFEEWASQHKTEAYLWSGLKDMQTSSTVENCVETITFTKINDVPNNAIQSWDGSESQNRSIMVWVLDEDNDNLYEIYIGQEGGVKANQNSSYLFFRFYNMTQINGLENLDTSSVTNMSSMFGYCNHLSSLDLSHFDTKKVTNMSYMFEGCKSLTSLDVSNFDTGNVTEMSSMFLRCQNLITTIVIKGTKCKYYLNIFLYAATADGAKITVNYTEDASELVDQMIATKSSNSNVIKGSVV